MSVLSSLISIAYLNRFKKCLIKLKLFINLILILILIFSFFVNMRPDAVIITTDNGMHPFPEGIEYFFSIISNFSASYEISTKSTELQTT